MGIVVQSIRLLFPLELWLLLRLLVLHTLLNDGFGSLHLCSLAVRRHSTYLCFLEALHPICTCDCSGICCHLDSRFHLRSLCRTLLSCTLHRQNLHLSTDLPKNPSTDSCCHMMAFDNHLSSCSYSIHFVVLCQKHSSKLCTMRNLLRMKVRFVLSH